MKISTIAQANLPVRHPCQIWKLKRVKKVLDKIENFFSVENPSFKGLKSSNGELRSFEEEMLENTCMTNDRHKYTDFL